MTNIKSTKKKGAKGVSDLAHIFRDCGFNVLEVPGSGALSNFSGDIQIKTKMFGKLQGEVKIRKSIGDYKLLYQDINNNFLAKREVGRHTAHRPKKFLITIEIDLFIELLKLADELAELKGVTIE